MFVYDKNKELERSKELTNKLLIKINELIKIPRLWEILQCGKIKNHNDCKSRFCPICSNKKSRQRYREMQEMSSYIKGRYPTARFYFLTLGSLPVVSSALNSRIKKINLAVANLLVSGRCLKITKQIKKNLLGYAKYLEVKYNSVDHVFNVHVHIIMAMKSTYTKNYINGNKWRVIWQELLQASYLPDVKHQCIDIDDDKINNLAKIAGYSTKGLISNVANFESYDSENIDDLIVFYSVIKSKKFITCGGIFKEARKICKQKRKNNNDKMMTFVA